MTIFYVQNTRIRRERERERERECVRVWNEVMKEPILLRKKINKKERKKERERVCERERDGTNLLQTHSIRTQHASITEIRSIELDRTQVQL